MNNGIRLRRVRPGSVFRQSIHQAPDFYDSLPTDDPSLEIQEPPKQATPEKLEASAINLSSMLQNWDEVASHLWQIGLYQYCKQFNENHIVTLHDLKLVTRKDLMDMQIPLKHRNIILDYARKLKKDSSPEKMIEFSAFENSPQFSPIQQKSKEQSPQAQPAKQQKDIARRRRLNSEIDEFMTHCQSFSRATRKSRPRSSMATVRTSRTSARKSAVRSSLRTSQSPPNREALEWIQEVLKNIWVKQEEMMNAIRENTDRIGYLSSLADRSSSPFSNVNSRWDSNRSIYSRSKM